MITRSRRGNSTGVARVLLETERLVLRRFADNDARHLFKLDSDPDVMRYLSGGTPTSREVIETEILPLFCRYDDRFPGFGFWAAIEKASNVFLGWFSLRHLDASNYTVAALGFRLQKMAWGQGYATEGVQALIRLGFTRLGVQRVVATVYEENLASRRVMEKAGMSLARRFRLTPADLRQVDTYRVAITDLWQGDDLEYSLTKSGWEQQRNAPPASP